MATTKFAADGDDSDPPIIVTGGGGISPTKLTAKNTVSVDYQPHGSSGRRMIRAHNNRATKIIGVQVHFATTPPTIQPPITLTGLETYNVYVTFLTEPEPERSPRRKKPQKKTKTPAKRSPATKRK